MKFIIIGSPRTKKNSQQIAKNRRTGSLFIASDPVKKKYQKTAVEQLAVQLAEMKEYGAWIPLDGPVHVRATFYRDKNLGDLVGYMQMIADCLEKGCVVVNDRLIESWDGTRMTKDADNPRTELEVTAL